MAVVYAFSVITVLGFGFTFYKIAKLVNQSSDIQMHVYVHLRDYEMFKSDIKDVEDWLHPVGNETRDPRNLIRGRFWKKLGASADLYLLSEDAPLFAFPKRGSRVVFLPIGFDLTVQPFPLMAIKSPGRIPTKFKRVLLALIQASRIRKMDEIWSSPYPFLKTRLTKIGRNLRLSKFLPFPIDFDAHDSIVSKPAHFNLPEGTEDRFLVFFPGRLMVTKSKSDILTGQTKGTAEAVHGFLKFQKRSKSNALLILIDHSISPDRSQILTILKESNSQDSVLWIKSPTSNVRLSNNEMAALYELSDVVLGDFGSGWFGQTALEAAAHGKPFISHIDPVFMVENFGFNPFMVAKTDEEISNCLFELFSSKLLRERQETQMRSWYQNFLCKGIVGNWYQTEIRRVVEKLEL
jgi:glycosyltransferase involved in cell wall biosynthesis